MNPTILFLSTTGAVALMAVVGYYVSRRRISAVARSGQELRATPDYYGWYVLTWMFVPIALVTFFLGALQLFGVVRLPGIYVAAAWVVFPALFFVLALSWLHPSLNVRVPVERVIYIALLSAALISIFTTIGILLSVLFESIRFFSHPDVSVSEFFFGTTWAPGGAFLEAAGRGGEQTARAQFGALPLFAGTFMISAIAMLVAVPVGLFAATYLSEYATNRFRRFAKPMLEILAGIPTVVYGFFAAITVAPLIVKVAAWFGIDASFQNALAPGLVMGVMIIPFMSSLCDDVITSVPQNIRRASYALGATRSETIKQVTLPAAMPGIVSAFLLAISRAIGETMIVVMAAGLTARLSANPIDEMSTVTVHIVANLTGDQEYDNPQTLSAFGLGLTLLVVTLILNVISLIVIRKFRQRYEAD